MQPSQCSGSVHCGTRTAALPAVARAPTLHSEPKKPNASERAIRHYARTVTAPERSPIAGRSWRGPQHAGYWHSPSLRRCDRVSATDAIRTHDEVPAAAARTHLGASSSRRTLPLRILRAIEALVRDLSLTSANPTITMKILWRFRISRDPRAVTRESRASSRRKGSSFR